MDAGASGVNEALCESLCLRSERPDEAGSY